MSKCHWQGNLVVPCDRLNALIDEFKAIHFWFNIKKEDVQRMYPDMPSNTTRVIELHGIALQHCPFCGKQIYREHPWSDWTTPQGGHLLSPDKSPKKNKKIWSAEELLWFYNRFPGAVEQRFGISWDGAEGWYVPATKKTYNHLEDALSAAHNAEEIVLKKEITDSERLIRAYCGYRTLTTEHLPKEYNDWIEEIDHLIEAERLRLTPPPASRVRGTKGGQNGRVRRDL